jgi:hypothetical protein
MQMQSNFVHPHARSPHSTTFHSPSHAHSALPSPIEDPIFLRRSLLLHFALLGTSCLFSRIESGLKYQWTTHQAITEIPFPAIAAPLARNQTSKGEIEKHFRTGLAKS